MYKSKSNGREETNWITGYHIYELTTRTFSSRAFSFFAPMSRIICRSSLQHFKGSEYRNRSLLGHLFFSSPPGRPRKEKEKKKKREKETKEIKKPKRIPAVVVLGATRVCRKKQILVLFLPFLNTNNQKE